LPHDGIGTGTTPRISQRNVDDAPGQNPAADSSRDGPDADEERRSNEIPREAVESADEHDEAASDDSTPRTQPADPFVPLFQATHR
jgi:hypothetical protein